MHNNVDISENLLNPAMLVFIEKLLMSTIRGVPICQGFNYFSAFFALFSIDQISHQQHKG